MEVDEVMTRDPKKLKAEQKILTVLVALMSVCVDEIMRNESSQMKLKESFPKRDPITKKRIRF